MVGVLAAAGVRMLPFGFNYSITSAQDILNTTMVVETLAHFDHWQRAGWEDQMRAQDQWPLELRRARLIPAVDYVQVYIFLHFYYELASFLGAQEFVVFKSSATGSIDILQLIFQLTN